MSTLLTLAILLVALVVVGASYARVARRRALVARLWREALSAGGDGTDNDAAARRQRARDRYTRAAQEYNTALAAFPGNVVAAAAGFRPAAPLPDSANAPPVQ